MFCALSLSLCGSLLLPLPPPSRIPLPAPAHPHHCAWGPGAEGCAAGALQDGASWCVCVCVFPVYVFPCVCLGVADLPLLSRQLSQKRQRQRQLCGWGRGAQSLQSPWAGREAPHKKLIPLKSNLKFNKSYDLIIATEPTGKREGGVASSDG